jgi:hypothetical protein
MKTLFVNKVSEKVNKNFILEEIMGPAGRSFNKAFVASHSCTPDLDWTSYLKFE